MLMCPYCGREYGSQSLPIHLKVCQTKHHDVKVSEEVVQKVLSGQMNKDEVLSISLIFCPFLINQTTVSNEEVNTGPDTIVQ